MKVDGSMAGIDDEALRRLTVAWHRTTRLIEGNEGSIDGMVDRLGLHGKTLAAFTYSVAGEEDAPTLIAGMVFGMLLAEEGRP